MKKQIDIANDQLKAVVKIAKITKDVWIEKAIDILENIPSYDKRCECRDCEYIRNNIKLLRSKLK